MTQLYSDSIFWVETEKIHPNPYQPRKEFDERALMDLADSIRQYGVLQPLVVTRKEIHQDDGGMRVEYELIAGERRLRASRLAGLPQVPVIIRQGHDDAKMKLELAIIENLQREDLNAIDRAKAFLQLHEEFGFTHAEIGKKMGKSREYVTNSLRLLALPDYIKQALLERRITEGHTRSLLMLADRPEEQETLFKEIVYKKLSVRETEKVARAVAKDKVRKKDISEDPQLVAYQEKFAQSLGTRVSIEKKEVGGKIVIDFFSPEDLEMILTLVKNNQSKSSTDMLQKFIEATREEKKNTITPSHASISAETIPEITIPETPVQDMTVYHQELPEHTIESSRIPEIAFPEISAPRHDLEHLIASLDEAPEDDRSQDEIHEDENRDDDMYNIKNFSI